MNFTSKIYYLSSIIVLILIFIFTFKILQIKNSKYEYILPNEIIKKDNAITKSKKTFIF